MTGITRLRMLLCADRRKDEEPLGKRLAREGIGTVRVCTVEAEQRHHIHWQQRDAVLSLEPN